MLRNKAKIYIWGRISRIGMRNPGLKAFYHQMENDKWFLLIRNIFDFLNSNLEEIMSGYQKKPPVEFDNKTKQLLDNIKISEISVLCGRNNSGKSYILKTLTKEIGCKSKYIGPSRYQNFHLLNQHSFGKNLREQTHSNFIRNLMNMHENSDANDFNLGDEISRLSDNQRGKFITIMEGLFRSSIKIELVDPENEMSHKYISVDGHNLSYTSSGYRLVAILIVSLLIEDYGIVLIDEPELGVSPEMQVVFSEFILNKSNREKYFPHIQSIVLATHSTVFLDREIISNNYFVEKNENKICLSQVESPADINNIHFFLLGNKLELLYMPTAIFIVEGETDKKFLERVLYVKHNSCSFSVISANNDARIPEVFHSIKSVLGDIQKSPYRNRVFAVLDSKHNINLRGKLVKSGLPNENIIIWNSNGIEYCYPDSIMKKIFCSDGKIVIDGDFISINGVTYKKNELADKVIAQIAKDTTYSDEFSEKFLDKINLLFK